MKTEMNYEKKYKEALEWIRSIYPTMQGADKEDAEHYFPELKEGEDERIRKELIQYLKDYPNLPNGIFCRNDFFAWLEKQGEKKPADKVEPKFKIGDWITNGEYTWKVTDIKPLDYILQSPNGDEIDDTISYVDEHFHLWNIQDVNDGDVLAIESSNKGYQYPFVAIYKKLGLDYFNSYCNIGFSGTFYINETGHCTDVHPATKEQRDLLFQKMHEAGYEWDAEKKELNKIEQNPAWSEEDERILNKIQDNLREFYVDKKGYPYVAEPDSPEVMEKNWLQSFKDRVQPNHWKPSEAHLRVLQTAIKDYGICVEKNVLESLYDDLKKL